MILNGICLLVRSQQRITLKILRAHTLYGKPITSDFERFFNVETINPTTLRASPNLT